MVTPSNISPGVFVQVAGNNNDINEETFDGKRTTHDTTLVLCESSLVQQPSRRSTQKKQRGNGHFNPLVYVNPSDSTVHIESGLLLPVSPGRYKCTENLHSATCMRDLAWALVRMTPMKVFDMELFPTEKQKVPGWRGFNAVVHSCVPVLTNIGYCPILDGQRDPVAATKIV